MINFYRKRRERIKDEEAAKVTQKDVDIIRKEAQGRRFCVSEEGRFFLPTLEEIKKHNYRLAEDVTDDELGLTTPAEKRVHNRLKIENAILESGENELEK